MALVAVAYLLAGRLALTLAVPPGFSTAIWPPAGIALAAMLMWGRGIWPGILIGSFGVNLWVSRDAVLAGRTEALIACALIGVGAVGQTLASRWLLVRFGDQPITLTRVADVTRFFLLGGAAGCLVNSLFGPAVLLACDIITAAQLPFNAWNWWVGDTIGVLIAAPLILIWSDYNGKLWQDYRLGITVTVSLAALGVIVMFFFGSKLELDRIDAEFRKSANAIEASVRGELDNAVRALGSLQGFFDSSDFVDSDEFGIFTSRMLQDHPSISAVSWNVIVKHADRERFESLRLDTASGPPSIYELADDGARVPAGVRDTYAVVTYIEPRELHASALGFDTLSNHDRRGSLELARDTGETIATPSLQLVQSAERRPGMLIFAPVFEGKGVPSTVDERRSRLAGFVVSVVFIDTIIAEALEDFQAGHLTVEVSEPLEPEGATPIFSTGTRRTTEVPLLSADLTVDFAGRAWVLTIAADNDYITAQRAPGVWFLLAAGLLLCALLSGFLLVLAGHAHREAQRAAHDMLTGLVNRREFEKRLTRALHRSRVHGAFHSLCFLDLDEFKVVNDSVGHAAGDAMLQQVAQRIYGHVRGRDTLARLGGDEFGLLLEHCPIANAEQVAERIVRDIRDFSFRWNGREFGVGVSIGLASVDPSTPDVAVAMQQADTACYAAKELGRSRVHVFRANGGNGLRRPLEMQGAASQGGQH